MLSFPGLRSRWRPWRQSLIHPSTCSHVSNQSPKFGRENWLLAKIDKCPLGSGLPGQNQRYTEHPKKSLSRLLSVKPVRNSSETSKTLSFLLQENLSLCVWIEEIAKCEGFSASHFAAQVDILLCFYLKFCLVSKKRDKKRRRECFCF